MAFSSTHCSAPGLSRGLPRVSQSLFPSHLVRIGTKVRGIHATLWHVPQLQLKCIYSSSLVKSYGEPEYAGSARYEEEAYARFSRADMRDLGEH
jgi:hypothetical protein